MNNTCNRMIIQLKIFNLLQTIHQINEIKMYNFIIISNEACAIEELNVRTNSYKH